MLTSKKIPILMYHSISHNLNPKFMQFTVPPAQFAEQMAYLHEHAYTPMTVAQYYHTTIEQLPENPVIITFDDGMADFFTEALPVLTKYKFPATLYITTAFVNSTCKWLQREGEATRHMVTWEQIAQIQAVGIECGAHSHTHPQLDTLPDAVVLDEIVQSKRLLEDHLQQEVVSFAYPFGYYTNRTRQLVSEAGYMCACTVGHKMASEMDNPFSLGRLMVKPTTSIDAFANMLTGSDFSFVGVAYKTYVRARTPAWQIVRRFSAAFVRSLQAR